MGNGGDQKIWHGLRQWLTDAEQDRLAQARAAAESYELMADKMTPYAQAIETMARAHIAAAEVYALKLRELAEPVTAISCGGPLCPAGGEHQWDAEVTEELEGGGGFSSVACSKCGITAMDQDMLGGP